MLNDFPSRRTAAYASDAPRFDGERAQTMDYKRVTGDAREWDATYRSAFETIVARGESVPLDSVTLLTPVPRPSKVLAAFSNYLDEPGRKPEDVIIEFFYKAPEVVGPEGTSHLLDIGPVYVWQPEAEIDKTHGARIAWGGGCPVEVWEDFARRYAVEIREGYGMTETSSFSTINIGGPVGSVGKAADFFDVEVMAEDGTPCVDGETGEICVREREPGVLTVGYYNNDAATAEARRGDWFLTGDFGVRNADGYISFKGRKKHSIRRRGENISSAQVEMAINDHPQVSETAVIGVKDDMGDEELKVYVLPADPADLDIPAIAEWCKGQMAAFQVPRFWAVVDSFPKTPTQRIQKHLLPQTQEAGDFDTACTKNTERS